MIYGRMVGMSDTEKMQIPEAAVPMIARNAAFLVLASKYPNSDLVYSVEFSQALKAALEAAAPHMQAEAWEQGWTAREDLHAYEVWGGGEPDSSNPYRPAP